MVELRFVYQIQREGRIRERSHTERKRRAVDETAAHAHRRGHRVSNYTYTLTIKACFDEMNLKEINSANLLSEF